MTELIRMSAEQMRRKGIENAELKRQREKEYNMKVEQMSKHNVGGLYDVRQIMKSKQFKEKKNHYNLQMAETELEDLLQANRLYDFKSYAEDYIKRVTGRETDSFNVRENGKFISELINQLKVAYEVKE